MTLTLVHSNAPLSHQIKSLYTHFKNFRRLKDLAGQIRGGIWFFQVTYNNFTHQYHPHLHCLLDSNYIAHAVLSNAWLRTTASSRVVDIRTVNDPNKAAEYVARYAASPLNLSDFQKSEYSEIYEAFRGLRICGTWGTARDITLSLKSESDKKKFFQIAPWGILRELAKHDLDAKQIIKCFFTGKPYPGKVEFDDIENFINGKIDEAAKNAKQLYLDYG